MGTALPIYYGVYPRLRGGSLPAIAVERARSGLSPPTRGIHIAAAIGVASAGSISAYAGDPARLSRGRSPTRVYPRLRGGSMNSLRGFTPLPGLSPPTRGILRLGILCICRTGSIPAYAGDPW